MARRRKKASGGDLVASLVTLAFAIALAMAKVAIQLLLLPFRLLAGSKQEKPGRQAAPRTRSGQGVVAKNSKWLDGRWKRMGVGTSEAGYPYDRHATDNQVARLAAKDPSLSERELQKLTAGQVSDINDLFYPLKEDDAEVLKFFKQSTAGLNQLSGEEAVVELLGDPDNARAWESRPPLQIQKEFYRFTGVKTPKGLNATEMAAHIQVATESLSEQVAEEWESFSDAFGEITSTDFRRDNEIKKASLTVFREAYESLKAEGKSFAEDLMVDDIAERIEELYPGFQK